MTRKEAEPVQKEEEEEEKEEGEPICTTMHDTTQTH
jgi:hypothetical protein